MKASARSARNRRYAALRNPIALYEIVREAARLAAARDPDPLKDAREVSQAAWNSAKQVLEPAFGTIPRANEVCRQLSDASGRSFPWRELLEFVLDEAQDIAAVHRQRLAQPARPVTRAQLEWALLHVACHLRARTLLPHEYREGREALLQSAPPKRRKMLALRLPTEGQILTCCGGRWDGALDAAGLQPRTASGPPRRAAPVPVVDAIVFYYGKLGHLPTGLELDEFAGSESFAKASHKGRPWHQHITDAVDRIAQLSWPEPPPYGASAQQAWRPLQHQLLAAPLRNRRVYRHSEVLDAVRNFVETLAGGNPTDRRWRAFSRGRHGVPSLGVIKDHGGLRALVAEAARPNWEQQAETWVDPRAQARRDKPRRTPTEQLAGRATKPEAHALLAALASHSHPKAKAKQLAEQLGWTVPKVRAWLNVLRAAGLAEQTQPWGKSKRQSYRLRTNAQKPPTHTQPAAAPEPAGPATTPEPAAA